MPTVQRADPTARRRAVVAMVAVVVLGVTAYVAIEAWLATARDRRALSSALLWATSAVATLLVAYGIHAWRLGRRVVVSLRFPPPGVRVARDTLVLEGPLARTRGRLIQALAVCLVVLAVALVGLVFRLTGVLG